MSGEGEVFWHGRALRAEARALRAEARALRAEEKLAELGRMLDGYRDRGNPLPTYSELLRLLEA